MADWREEGHELDVAERGDDHEGEDVEGDAIDDLDMARSRRHTVVVTTKVEEERSLVAMGGEAAMEEGTALGAPAVDDTLGKRERSTGGVVLRQPCISCGQCYGRLSKGSGAYGQQGGGQRSQACRGFREGGESEGDVHDVDGGDGGSEGLRGCV